MTIRVALLVVLQAALGACTGPARSAADYAKAHGFQEDVTSGPRSGIACTGHMPPQEAKARCTSISKVTAVRSCATRAALDPAPLHPLMLYPLALDPARSLLFQFAHGFASV